MVILLTTHQIADWLRQSCRGKWKKSKHHRRRRQRQITAACFSTREKRTLRCLGLSRDRCVSQRDRRASPTMTRLRSGDKHLCGRGDYEQRRKSGDVVMELTDDVFQLLFYRFIWTTCSYRKHSSNTRTHKNTKTQ